MRLARGLVYNIICCILGLNESDTQMGRAHIVAGMWVWVIEEETIYYKPVCTLIVPI